MLTDLLFFGVFRGAAGYLLSKQAAQQTGSLVQIDFRLDQLRGLAELGLRQIHTDQLFHHSRGILPELGQQRGIVFDFLHQPGGHFLNVHGGHASTISASAAFFLTLSTPLTQLALVV